MGETKTRPCIWCDQPFKRRSRWRAKRYCKRRHQLVHYGAVVVGFVLS